MFYKKQFLHLIMFLSITTTVNSQNKLLDSLKKQLTYKLNDTVRAKILGDLTWYHKSTSLDSSIKYGYKGIDLLKSIDNKRLLAQQFSDMGTVFLLKGEMYKSKDFYLESLKIREILNDTIGSAKILGNLAGLYQRQQKLDTAMMYSVKAMKILEEKGAKNNASRIKSNVASMYIDLKAYDKALEYLKEILEYQTSIEDNFFRANTLSNMGNVFLFKFDTLQAIKHYELAINFSNKSKNSQAKSAALSNLGNIFSAKNNSQKAISYFNQSLEIREKLNSDYDIASLKLSLGMEYLRTGNIKDAKVKFLESLPYLEENNIIDKLIPLYSNLSNLYAYEKNVEKVRFYYDKHLKLNSIYSSENQAEKIAEVETKYETAKKEAEIAQQKEQLLEQELAIKNRNLYAILLASALLILGIIFFGIFKKNQFKRNQLQKEIDLKDALATIKTQNRLQEQRLRISRDLHDNIGSQLTFIISSIDNLKFISKDANVKLKDKLSTISSFTSGTIHELRDTIWAMNKSKISVEDLHSRILSFIEKAKIAVPEMEFEILYTIDKNTSFSSLIGMNLFRVIQEAINNAIKYAEANKLEIHLKKDQQNFVISIIDNGKGFNINSVDLGNGLSNMEKRMSEIDAKVSINSKEKIGTEIKLEIALENTSNDL